jgi:four helix bundle protein
MQLVTEICQATQAVPRVELHRLTNQLWKAAVSVPNNFAEGRLGFSSKEFHLFRSHAHGSLVEIETELMIALSLGYLRTRQSRALLDEAAELSRILNHLG